MIIRREEQADQAGIREVVRAAFATPAEARLVDKLRADGDAVISLVAVEEGAVVGHVMFSRMAAPPKTLGMAPVAVSPARQRTGIGSRLVQEGLALAKSDGWETVVVLGAPAYYTRFGFDPALTRDVVSPFAGPNLMAQKLTQTAPPLVGRVDYAPAFTDLH
jgi:putative acetyltransferase